MMWTAAQWRSASSEQVVAAAVIVVPTCCGGVRGWPRRSLRCRSREPRQVDAPHDAQGAASAVPHSAEKRRSARLSWSQDGQRIPCLLARGDYHTLRGLRKERSAFRTTRRVVDQRCSVAPPSRFVPVRQPDPSGVCHPVTLGQEGSGLPPGTNTTVAVETKAARRIRGHSVSRR
jgi:hypothetical protein